MSIIQNEIVYEKIEGLDYWIVKGICKNFHEKTIVIPENINGYCVAVIGKDAFRGNQMIREVLLPDTIQIIGEHAFSDSQKIKKIEIYTTTNTYALPIRILRGAFENCVELYEVHFKKEIDLVDPCIQPACQFDSCPMLRILDGELVNTVAKWTFMYCLSLDFIKLAEGVEIKHDAFVHCDNLHNVLVGNNKINLTPATLRFLKKKIIHCTTDSNLADLAYDGYNIKIM
jgi:hypothetical protein